MQHISHQEKSLQPPGSGHASDPLGVTSVFGLIGPASAGNSSAVASVPRGGWGGVRRSQRYSKAAAISRAGGCCSGGSAALAEARERVRYRDQIVLLYVRALALPCRPHSLPRRHNKADSNQKQKRNQILGGMPIYNVPTIGGRGYCCRAPICVRLHTESKHKYVVIVEQKMILRGRFAILHYVLPGVVIGAQPSLSRSNEERAQEHRSL